MITKHNPIMSIVCAVIMLAVAVFFTVVEFIGNKSLDRMQFAAMVLLWVFGTGTLLREFLRHRKRNGT